MSEKKRKLSSLDDVNLVFNDGKTSSACAALLRMASPVFDAMFTSGMDEEQTMRVQVEIATKEEFDEFYKLLKPGVWTPELITDKNADSLLAISDYYGVKFITKACEKKLAELPVTARRLIQAHKHNLKAQSKRCLEGLATNCTDKDLAEIRKADPDILLQVACALRVRPAQRVPAQMEDEAEFVPVIPVRQAVKLRNSYPYWWADFGCSLRGGMVIAERSGQYGEGELEPWAVHIHDQALYIIDGREPCCVLQWPLGALSGRVVVGTGSTLNGVNDFSDIIDIAIDANGDLFVLDGQHGRIVRRRPRVTPRETPRWAAVELVVGDGVLSLDVGTRALYIGTDGSIYFIDEGGSRVQRYYQGMTVPVAGGPESGDGASQLEDAEDIFVTKDGVLYVSDSGNNRIQKWLPGATSGVTVAGGHGKGSRCDQLQHPVGLHVTEEHPQPHHVFHVFTSYFELLGVKNYGKNVNQDFG
eukprot:g5148.t1